MRREHARTIVRESESPRVLAYERTRVRNMNSITLTGFDLNWENIRGVLYTLPKVSLSPKAKEEMEKSRRIIEERASGKEPIYGINTGFGKLTTTRISPKDLEALQENLIHSHAVGVGEPLSEPISRLSLFLRANVLAQGYSGVRSELVQFLCELINKGITPVIPSQGSVGASGDLAPLAHMAKVLIGEGEVWFQGERHKTASVFEKIGLQKLSLATKEGISLVNGTQVSLAIACDVLLRAERLIKLADMIGALSVEGNLASFAPFDERLVKTRPYSGFLKTASNLRKMFLGSEMNLSHKNCERVQDPYSFRCIPQVHGTVKESYHFVEKLLATELNATTDNPLVFSETGTILSGGNFHGEPIALAMDTLTMAMAELGSISERRVAVLIDPNFLIPNPGVQSGFMIPHVVMSALVSENKTLSHPASVDTIPTSAGQEDHVSMSCWASLKAKKVVANIEKILGVELLAACQAIDLNANGNKPGKGTKAVHEYVRERLPFLKEDKHLSSQLEVAYKFVAEEILIDVAEKTVGNLEI